MIRASALAALFFSATAFACPNLAGDYTCNYDGSTVDITVSQRVENGVDVYELLGYELYADGTLHDVPETDQVKNGTALASCNGDILNAHVTGNVYSSGKDQGLAELDVTVAGLNKDGVSEAHAAGNLTRPSGEVWPIDANLSCTRK